MESYVENFNEFYMYLFVFNFADYYEFYFYAFNELL